MRKIFGIGVDLCVSKRVFEVYERVGNRFLKRAFHEEEIEQFANLTKARQPQWLASR